MRKDVGFGVAGQEGLLLGLIIFAAGFESVISVGRASPGVVILPNSVVLLGGRGGRCDPDEFCCGPVLVHDAGERW